MVAAIRAFYVNVRFDTVRVVVPDSIIAPESLQALLAAHGAFMSEILDCDPDRGFVAFPVALFDLDLTPGAFRTLAELCRMANASGQCWPSLAQLGRRLGRSRASVSAYISELRDTGVLSTEEQKMANGYNYRLRYTVTFWEQWRAGLSQRRTKEPCPSVPQKAECRVQPTERPLETKNHIHLKQHESGNISQLVSAWRMAVANAPYPEFSQWPADELIAETETALELAPSVITDISADIEAAAVKFASRHSLGGDQASFVRDIKAALTSGGDLETLFFALNAVWQSHCVSFPMPIS